MKSLFAKLTLWLVITLVGISLAFFAAMRVGPREQAENAPPWMAVDELKLDLALQRLDAKGLEGLRDLLEHFDRQYGPGHRLVDANGRDVLTGQDMGRLLTNPEGMPSPFARSVERGYILMAPPPPMPTRPVSRLWPYVVLIVTLVGAASWLFTLHLVRPLRRLRATVRDFGAGHLSIRMHADRRDEIGDLSRDFDAMADRLERLLQLERRLLQDVSHELRTPLARLVLAIELERYADARAEVSQLTAIIGELVEMTRAEAGLAQLETATIDMSALLTGLAADYVVRAEVDAGLQAKGQEPLLRRALENILQNAVRYSPEDQSPVLRGRRTGSTIVITVRDLGPGVPDEALPNLFRPFYRTLTAQRTNPGGMGLGLAIAERAIRLHGGTITPRNAHPGLEIEIRLPM